MTAIILAGGKSSRMKGANKPLLKFGSQTMIGRIITKLEELFSEVIIVTREPELYQTYQVSIVVDKLKYRGPLTGIHAGLIASDDQYNFVVSCDLPLLNLELIEYICHQPTADIVVPRINNYLEPLHALYNKSCISRIAAEIKAGNLRATDLDSWAGIDVDYIEEEEIKRFDPQFHSFFNVNTRQDYQKALQIVE
ncbi:MAG: molybdenum cofactor guanylyltransferase [Bacillota bacterium]